MENNLIILTIAAVVLAISIHNLFVLWRISSLAKKRNPIVNDARYFELKSRMEMYAIIVTILIALFAYIGFDTYKNTTDKLETELNSTIERLTEVDSLITEADSSIHNIESFINNFDRQQKTLSSIISNSQGNINEIQDDIKSIASQELSGLYLYIIPKVRISNVDRERLYFKDLTTSDGKKLPEFSSTPYTLFSGAEIYVSNVNSEYIEIEVMSYLITEEMTADNEGPVDDDHLIIDIWIAAYDK